ncbi:hypothetical protein RhoFasK5_02133|nr:hypothetical protein [Rhodococcus kroppenstedtii]
MGGCKMRAHLDRLVLPGLSYGTVDRVMKTLRHNGVRRSRCIRTTIPAADVFRAGDLLNRQFRADEPNRVWVTDFLYVRSSAGWVYVVFIVDVFPRLIIAWHASTSKNLEVGTVARLDIEKSGGWDGAAKDGVVATPTGRTARESC